MNEIKKTPDILKVNDPAPDFTLNTHNEGELNLAWYQGRKNVVLAFYPGDWTPVCSNQIPEYQRLLEKFEKNDCQLLCISVDSVPCHKAWAKSLGGLSFPLMADTNRFILAAGAIPTLTWLDGTSDVEKAI